MQICFDFFLVQSVCMWHVLRQDPKKMHEWTFPVSSIKSVSQCRRNAKALFLYVYENSDDFHIFFPSEIHKQRFYDMVLDMLSRYEEENHIGRVIDIEAEVQKTAIRVNRCIKFFDVVSLWPFLIEFSHYDSLSFGCKRAYVSYEIAIVLKSSWLLQNLVHVLAIPCLIYHYFSFFFYYEFQEILCLN